MFSTFLLITSLFLSADSQARNFFPFFDDNSEDNYYSSRTPGFEGSVDFSNSEIVYHRRSVPQLNQSALACLEAHQARQNDFYSRYGIGAYYGTHSTFFPLSEREKRDVLRQKGLNPDLLSELNQLSCVDLVIKCLKQAFTETNQASTFAKINQFVVRNGGDGTALLLALQRLGWRVLYWSQDLSRLAEFDRMEKEHKPGNEDRFWGYHEYRYSTVVGPKHSYYFNPVDDATTLVNYGEGTPPGLSQFPYWVGTAHTGFHMFSGTGGKVIEAHSDTQLDDADGVESGPFNPTSKTAQHPDAGNYGIYRSGIIAVPPGY